LDNEKEGVDKPDLGNMEGLCNIHHKFDEIEKPDKTLNSFQGFSDFGSSKAKLVGGMPARRGFKRVSEKSSAPKLSIGRFSNNDFILLERKVRDPKLFSADLVRREKTSARFLSVGTPTGRMVSNKKNRLLLKRSLGAGSHGERLSESRKLQLFRALLKKPLAALELRASYGVSKQSLKGFCRKGLIAEVWGPGTVGLRFGLTRKGKGYLAELKAAAKYDLSITNRGSIRLKNRF
jgi:hypothetical protein